MENKRSIVRLKMTVEFSGWNWPPVLVYDFSTECTFYPSKGRE